MESQLLEMCQMAGHLSALFVLSNIFSDCSLCTEIQMARLSYMGGGTQMVPKNIHMVPD